MEREIPGQLQGEIYSWTVVRQPPAGLEQYAPYGIAWVSVELPGGGKRLLTARITDLDPNRMDPAGVEEQVQTGDRVELVTRNLMKSDEYGPLIYGYAARLTCEEGS